jgi:hypothetical protein
MDSNALYGYMVGAGLLMAASIAMVTAFLPIEGMGKYISLGVFFVIAYGFHLGFLTWLQAEACSGVKSFKSIALGSLLGSLFVVGCVAIPLHMDWARLAFSDLIRTHYALLTPEVSDFARKFVSVMRQQGGANEQNQPSLSNSETPVLTETSKSVTATATATAKSSDILALQELLDQTAYDKQTVTETAISTPFWAFLAGATGIGIGNLISGSACN